MNKKGFILIETIVVMSIVMIALLGIYNTYVTVIKKSYQREYYDNINDIYRLNIIKELVSTDVGTFTTYTSTSPVALSDLVTGGTEIKIYVIPEGDINNPSVTNTLKRYLETTDYNVDKIIVLNYKMDGKEYFASLEVK